MLLVTKLLYYRASLIGIKFVELKGIHFLVAETTKPGLYPLLKRYEVSGNSNALATCGLVLCCTTSQSILP